MDHGKMEHKMLQPLAETFRPELLALRRRMLGLGQIQLAERAGIAQGTLSKLEQGLRPATDDLIEKLGTALNCPVSFFCRAERVYGAPLSAHAMFRKHAATGQKVIDRLIAEVNVRIGHIRTLLESADIAPELPFPHYDLDDFNGDAAQIARNVRRAWYMPAGPINDLTEYAERAGCIVTICDMSDVGVDGISYRLAGLPPLIFLNKRRPADRQRFSLAHELGHLVMHDYPTPTMEEEADRFASEFLMPADDIGPYLGDLTLEKAAYMKPFWKVSMAALIVRAGSLNRIDSGKSQWLWRQMSSRGYRTQEPSALDFPPEQPSVMKGLIDNLTNNLGYSQDDLVGALNLHLDELAQLYDLQSRISLRLVKNNDKYHAATADIQPTQK